MAALLHGQRVRLLGEGLPDLSQVAVVVHLVSVKQSPLPSISHVMSKLLAFGMTGWVKFGLLLSFGFLRSRLPDPGRVVDEGEVPALALEHLSEPLLFLPDRPRLLDHPQDVRVLLPDGVVPDPVQGGP